MEIKTLTHQQVLDLLPNRDIRAHKGNFGRILMLCGSVGYTGAAALAAMGALRSGAGLVFLGVPESVYPILAMKLTEPVVFPLPAAEGRFSLDAIPEIGRRLSSMDAVLLGPGMGCSEGTEAVLDFVLSHFDGPIVLDADGINLAAMHKDWIRGRSGITVLTPHEGEFTRLGYSLSGDRISDAVGAAADLGGIVVLKGHGTVITDGVNCYVNSTGNPGMAVGGSGDVLAGMIASLLAQGIPHLQAVACGVWLHGASGDSCAKALGQYGMLPSDMLAVLPQLMK